MPAGAVIPFHTQAAAVKVHFRIVSFELPAVRSYKDKLCLQDNFLYPVNAAVSVYELLAVLKKIINRGLAALCAGDRLHAGRDLSFWLILFQCSFFRRFFQRIVKGFLFGVSITGNSGIAAVFG